MASYGWGMHQLQWHNERQWDLMSPGSRQAAIALGWGRARRQEGDPGNGLDFLVMHRAMIELLRENFPGQAKRLQGWSTVPTDPNDPSEPMPFNRQPREFTSSMRTAVSNLESSSFLRTLASDDALGLYIQSRRLRGATNPDSTAGIHHYLHNRFSMPGDPADLGDPSLHLNNARFWRLHGWLDSRWTAYRQAKGLPPEDPTLRALIDAEKSHMLAHGPMRERAATARGRVVTRALHLRSIPQSLRRSFEETPQRRFAAAMASDEVPDTIEELREMAQLAIELEWFTLPPYLTALWSLKDRDQHPEIRNILLSVAMEEMLHMALNCNLLVGLGGSPKLLDPQRFPKYPDFPPGIALSRPVALQAFSREALELFMEIEKPSHDPIPIPTRSLEATLAKAPTIGEFYARLLKGIELVNPPWITARQVTSPLMPDLKVIDSIDAARQAIGLIVEQGEGTTASAKAGEFSDELAHYYRYQQILDGMLYSRQPDGSFIKDPDQPVTFPDPSAIHEIGVVPAGGYPEVEASMKFDRNYTNMITKLQETWDSGDSDLLNHSFAQMHSLTARAQALMATPRPDGNGVCAPAFGFFTPQVIAPAINDATPAPDAAVRSVASQRSTVHPIASNRLSTRSSNALRTPGGEMVVPDKRPDQRDGNCHVVATGGVGESGTAALLIHRSNSIDDKVVVLRTVSSSLCGNQAVIASLIVDGVPVQTAILDRVGDSLRTTVKPGSDVVATLALIPRFNDIVCIRLGELQVELGECDPDSADSISNMASGIESRNWHAWVDCLPPRPARLQVIGEILVSNPGVVPHLVERFPQRTESRDLIADLLLIQSPGIWPQVMTWKSVSFERLDVEIDRVEVFFQQQHLASLHVTTVN